MIVDSGWRSTASKSNTGSSATFTPLTDAMPSHGVSRVGFVLELATATVNVQPAIQYSTDGVTWDSPAGIFPVDFTGSVGLKYYDGPIACPGDFSTASWSSTPPTEQLFVRFGVICYNVSGTKPELARVRLTVRVFPQVSGSVTSAPFVAMTLRDTATLTISLPQVIASERVSFYRLSWEMVGTTANMEIRPGYQLSNDGESWDGAIDPGLPYRSSTGITFGTTWTSIAPTKRFIRPVLLAKRTSGTDEPECCTASVRFEWRE